MSCRIPVVACFILACALSSPGRAAGEMRYSAQFASGKRHDGAEIHEWHDPAAQPHLDNQKFFFPADHAVWIEDNTIPPAEPPNAFVEFFGGDRLPGRVTEYRTGSESIFRRTPPCLVVVPEAGLDWPDIKRTGGLPVVVTWLRRVVWQKRDDGRYRPGTLYYLDGRQIEFRAVRWLSGSVRLLLEQETREVSFGEIAELHLPRLDPWEAWFDQLAVIAPDLSGYIMQVETGDSLRATTSAARFQPATRGDGGNPDNWWHAVQPAWSLEPLWLRHRSIRARRFFVPQEVPLSAIEPARAIQKSNLGGVTSWQLDRNARSGPLRCAEQMFGWGLGVHAYSELVFDLPASARVFRTQYGLDRVVGPGGCVKASIFAGPPTAPPLHQSAHLIGSGKSYDTGPLAVAGAKQLTLVVDPALNDRPAGADPFDIRDLFDWLQPVVQLDPEGVKAEIERRAGSAVACWQGWTIAARETKPLVVSMLWDQGPPQVRRCRVEVSPREVFFTLARRQEIGERDRFLVLTVSRHEKDAGPSRIQVRINGKAAAEFDVPVRAGTFEPDPLAVSVERFRGETVDIELTQIAQSPQSRVEWRGIGLSRRDPIVFEAFEDDAEFAARLSQGEGAIALDTEDKFSGAASLRVTADDRNSPALRGWNLAVRADPEPGEFRFMRFAWKKRGGKEIGLHLAHDGAFAAAAQHVPKETYRYHVGRGVKHDYGKSVELRPTPPDQWEVVTRDLFADFGQFNVTGLRLVCGDGEWAAFDHIYFARRAQDLDRVTQRVKTPPPEPLAALSPEAKANVVTIATDPARFGEALGEVAPAFSTSGSAEGVWLLKSYQGRMRVARTHPPEQGKPCILRSAVAIPVGKKTELKLSVSHHPQSDWQLLVFANGEKLHDSLIAENSTQEGWFAATIDLSRFAGHNIVLEVHNHPNNWSNEYAYWNRVEVVSQ